MSRKGSASRSQPSITQRDQNSQNYPPDLHANSWSAKKIMLSYDEWNVWNVSRSTPMSGPDDGHPFAPRLLEEQYTLADAIVAGTLLITLLRNADRVAAASLAQLVNVIAPS